MVRSELYGRPDAEAQLPDGFAQTTLTDEFAQRSMLDLADLEVTFPDLAGRLQRLDPNNSIGKVTLIEVFGSWCPNCHDEAELLNELQQEYGESGLKILGLAFELTGDIDRDTHQVLAYVDRHAVDYPILIVGTSDKALASQKLPWIDQLRSYPTTLFIDKAGKIRSITPAFLDRRLGNLISN